MTNLHSVYLLYLLIGIILTLLAAVNWLNTAILGFIFILILIIFFYVSLFHLRQLGKLTKLELLIAYLLVAFWALHFLQVLVPETGFDALWYHLSVVKTMQEVGGLVFIPNLYQSVNPLFSDLYFLTGFSVLGILGVKIIAYIFAVFLIVTTYSLSRLFLPRNLSLLVILLVSTFQVIAWQASSFYVDVAKAFFEICGLYFVLLSLSHKKDSLKSTTIRMRYNKLQLHSLLFFSASLATKLFSIFLIPAFIFIFGFKRFFSKKIIQNVFLLFCIPAIYYLFAYKHTGNPLYSFSMHVNKLSEIGGEKSLINFILNKIIQLPLSLIYFVKARDYVNPVLVLFLIPIFLHFKNIWNNEKIRILLFFGAFQWLIWWFLPPLSTRYALSGFIILLIVGFWVVKKFYLIPKKRETIFIGVLILFATISIIPRLIVAQRSLKYILGTQTQNQYLQQFYDGWIDEKINAWY